VHYANLCRDLQRARRDAFEGRRAKRAEAMYRLEGSLAAEQAETDAATVAARRALAQEARRTPAKVMHAAQRALDHLAVKKITKTVATLERRYQMAVKDEKAVVDAVGAQLDASARLTAEQLQELSAAGTKAVGPAPSAFVTQVLGGALASTAPDKAEWLEHWEAEEAGAMRDAVDKAVADGLLARRARAREAALDDATRAAAREATERRKAMAEAVQRLQADDAKLEAESANPLTLQKEHVAQFEVAWDARALGQHAAAEELMRFYTNNAKRVMPEAAARREAFTAARFTPETSLEAAFVAYATRAQVQRLVADEALESEAAFYQASQALEARHAAELAQVIKETRGAARARARAHGIAARHADRQAQRAAAGPCDCGARRKGGQRQRPREPQTAADALPAAERSQGGGQGGARLGALGGCAQYGAISPRARAGRGRDARAPH
jgi:hypothetical protein